MYVMQTAAVGPCASVGPHGDAHAHRAWRGPPTPEPVHVGRQALLRPGVGGDGPELRGDQGRATDGSVFNIMPDRRGWALSGLVVTLIRRKLSDQPTSPALPAGRHHPGQVSVELDTSSAEIINLGLRTTQDLE